MTTRIGILPYGPSDSCAALRNALTEVYSNNNDINVRLLRSGNNSVFRGRSNDIIINYGNRSTPAEVFGTAHVINAQSSLNNAANKLNALNTMRSAGVSTVEFTTDRTVAMGWAGGGQMVYARTTLNGHSGEGIVVVTADNITEMPQAPLYTKGVSGQRREWRIHVFDGVITHVQVKRRRNGFAEDPAYREDVRNHQTGWIYATENINPSQAVLRNAVEAVRSMGLDFGAVDVISFRNDAWVLEVNTAPGLQAETTISAFTSALTTYIHNRLNPNNQIAYTEAFTVEDQEDDGEVAQEAIPVELNTVSQNARMRADESSIVESSSPSQPEVQNNTVGANLPSHEDGYYLVDFRQINSTVWVSNVICWISNNRAYRHGWNTPITEQNLRNIRRITSVVASGQSVSF